MEYLLLLINIFKEKKIRSNKNKIRNKVIEILIKPKS